MTAENADEIIYMNLTFRKLYRIRYFFKEGGRRSTWVCSSYFSNVEKEPGSDLPIMLRTVRSIMGRPEPGYVEKILVSHEG